MLIKSLYLSHTLEAIVKFFGKIGAWLSIPLIFIIIFDIITRRFFILGSTKIQEMEWHLHTAIFLLALGFAYVKNSHVRIEIIREQYSPTLQSPQNGMGSVPSPPSEAAFELGQIEVGMDNAQVPFLFTLATPPTIKER